MLLKLRRALKGPLFVCVILVVCVFSGCAQPEEAPAATEVRALEARQEARVSSEVSRLSETTPDQTYRFLLTYAQPPGSKEVEAIEEVGGRVVRVWDRCAYVIMADVKAGVVKNLETDTNTVYIDVDQGGSASLMNAMVQTGARSVTGGEVGGLSLSGSGQTIAVLDSGVDASHPDLAGRVVGWVDFVGPDGESPGFYEAPIDPFGHGTGVSATAAGSGEGSSEQGFSLTASQRFPNNEGSGDTISFPARSLRQPARIHVLLDPVEETGGLHGINLLDENRTRLGRIRNADNPMEATFEGLEVLDALDTFNFAVSLFSSATDEIETGGSPYEAQITVPFEPIDERPLTLGAAPGASIIGLKVLDDGGSFGSAAPILDALTWLYDNGEAEGISVANASLNFNRGGPNTAVDSAVNRLVRDIGIAFVASARNGQDEGIAVASPATAEMSMAVGAVTVHDSITSYSSTGGVMEALIKPDIVAPGGSNAAGRIVTADSNSAVCKSFAGDDCVFETDRFRDDYRTYTGTSFAAPHVAGVLALLLEADGGVQYGSGDQVRRLSALLKMTATEVQTGESAAPGPPGRDLAPKDHVEGFGRLNVPAAVEALTQAWPEEVLELSETLGGGFGVRRSWARRVSLTAGEPVSLELSLPEDADYDLYLFSAGATDQGEPVILDAATRSTAGTDEVVLFVPNTDREAIVVVKWIRGEGEFSIRRQPAEDICLAPDPSFIGTLCNQGRGLCEAEGIFVCSDSRDTLVCDAVAGAPQDELCGSGVDEDCDGVADEGFDLVGVPCQVGLGACTARGAHVCAEDGLETVCSAVAGEPVDEICGDRRDNDCDGELDEGFDGLGEACEVGVGACVNRSILICALDGVGTLCPVEPLPPGEELCDDGVDNDCDGSVDEGFETLGEVCQAGEGACAVEGVLVCGPARAQLICNAEVDENCGDPVVEDEGCATVQGSGGAALLWWVLVLGLLARRRRPTPPPSD